MTRFSKFTLKIKIYKKFKNFHFRLEEKAILVYFSSSHTKNLLQQWSYTYFFQIDVHCSLELIFYFFLLFLPPLKYYLSLLTSSHRCQPTPTLQTPPPTHLALTCWGSLSLSLSLSAVGCGVVVVVVVWVDRHRWVAGFVGISGLWLGSSVSVGGLGGFCDGGCGCCRRSTSDPRCRSECLLADRVGFQ